MTGIIATLQQNVAGADQPLLNGLVQVVEPVLEEVGSFLIDHETLAFPTSSGS